MAVGNSSGMGWLFYVAVVVVVIMIGVLLYAVVVVNNSNSQLSFPKVGTDNPSYVQKAVCGNNICEPSERNGTVALCSIDCWAIK